MYNLKAFEKPHGFRDLLPEAVIKKRAIESKLQSLFSKWGYQEIMTPTLEFEETVGKASRIPSYKMFKLLDKLGQNLVLRPDMTAPIARVVSSMLNEDLWPQRIAYHTNVFRAQENEAGKVAEFFQSGVELIGEGSPDADAEILALACQALNKLDIGSFKLVVGHAGFLNGIFDEWVNDFTEKSVLKGLLADKNIVGFREQVKRYNISPLGKEVLLAIPDYQGDITKIKALLEQINSAKAREALSNLIEIWNLLEVHQVEEQIFFDLSIVPHLDYYSGMVFEGAAENTYFPICSGGRYDALLESFNNPKQAIGFALKINRILEIAKIEQVQEQGIKIIYDLEHQQEAIAYAIKLRSEGDKVVKTYRIENIDKLRILQELQDLIDPKACIYFLGEERSKLEY